MITRINFTRPHTREIVPHNFFPLNVSAGARTKVIIVFWNITNLRSTSQRRLVEHKLGVFLKTNNLEGRTTANNLMKVQKNKALRESARGDLLLVPHLPVCLSGGGIFLLVPLPLAHPLQKRRIVVVGCTITLALHERKGCMRGQCDAGARDEDGRFTQPVPLHGEPFQQAYTCRASEGSDNRKHEKRFSSPILNTK